MLHRGQGGGFRPLPELSWTFQLTDNSGDVIWYWHCFREAVVGETSTMGRISKLLAFTGTVPMTVGVCTTARAQDADDLKRGVARISLINGDVSVRRGDSGDWVAGVINAPLLTDDRIGTGANSRGEVQF